MNAQSTEDFLGSENSLHDTVMMEPSHHTFVQTRRMYTKCELWSLGDYDQSAMINHQFWWVMVVMGEAMHVWGSGDMGNLSIFLPILLSTQNCFKNIVFIRKEKEQRLICIWQYFKYLCSLVGDYLRNVFIYMETAFLTLFIVTKYWKHPKCASIGMWQKHSSVLTNIILFFSWSHYIYYSPYY